MTDTILEVDGVDVDYGKTQALDDVSMLAVGRALMRDPRVLRLDEPTLGLAPVIIDHISDAVDRLSAEGLTSSSSRTRRSPCDTPGGSRSSRTAASNSQAPPRRSPRARTSATPPSASLDTRDTGRKPSTRLCFICFPIRLFIEQR
jgi:hypothetical protein